MENCLSRHADGSNAGTSRRRDDRFPNAGKRVDVTVSVDVSDTDTQRSEPGELRAALGGDMLGRDATHEGAAHELR